MLWFGRVKDVIYNFEESELKIFIVFPFEQTDLRRYLEENKGKINLFQIKVFFKGFFHYFFFKFFFFSQFCSKFCLEFTTFIKIAFSIETSNLAIFCLMKMD